MMDQHQGMLGQQPQPMLYPATWMQVPAPHDDNVTPESTARAGRRQKHREYENAAASRNIVGINRISFTLNQEGMLTKAVRRRMPGMTLFGV
jgi:hypothetical protein